MKHHIVHIWKGQEGTMCGLRHIHEDDGWLWLSKMKTRAAIQINCKKCLKIYEEQAQQEPKTDV